MFRAEVPRLSANLSLCSSAANQSAARLFADLRESPTREGERESGLRSRGVSRHGAFRSSPLRVAVARLSSSAAAVAIMLV